MIEPYDEERDRKLGQEVNGMRPEIQVDVGTPAKYRNIENFLFYMPVHQIHLPRNYGPAMCGPTAISLLLNKPLDSIMSRISYLFRSKGLPRADGMSGEEIALTLLTYRVASVILYHEAIQDPGLTSAQLLDIARIQPGLCAKQVPGGEFHVAVHDSNKVYDPRETQEVFLEDWSPTVVFLCNKIPS